MQQETRHDETGDKNDTLTHWYRSTDGTQGAISNQCAYVVWLCVIIIVVTMVRAALCIVVGVWLYVAIRRYRSASEVETLRQENTKLKEQLQRLGHKPAASVGGGGGGDVLMTPPALPRLGGKMAAAAGSRYEHT